MLSAPSATRSASWTCRPTRTTASRPRAPSRTFPISGLRAPADLVTATILVKKAAAEANAALGRLDARRRRRDRRGGRRDPRRRAARSVRRRRLSGRRRHVAQHERERGARQSRRRDSSASRAAPTRACTRTITSTWASRRTTSSRRRRASRCCSAPRRSSPPPRALADSLARKADEFADVLKTGRTHLQDAVPITLGQEFGGYAACVRRGADDVDAAAEQLQELNIGATAVGTGLNAGDDYRRLVVAQSRAVHRTCRCKPAANLFRVTQSMGDVLAYSGAMRRLAVEVGKVASDLRLLSMGPRAGIVRDRAAGRAAGLVDHAGQGEPVGAGDGQPGLLPGDGLRHDGRDRLRGRTARAERDDAGHRVERAARVDDPARGDEGVPPALRRRHRRGRGAGARAARSQHGDARRRSARTSATPRPRRSRRSR